MTIDTSAYRLLGTTGLKVSPLTLGAMMFGRIGNPDHEDSVRIIHRALDAGINVIDTADVYSRGESEEIVGKALAGRRDDVIVATKVHGAMSDDHPNQQGNSRGWIIREVENSLRRLKTDYIDLYQLHRPRPETDIDDTLSALSDLVHAGKVRYIGTTTFLPSQVVEAQWVADRRHRERPVTEQAPYSILAREVERDLLPTAQKYGLGVLPWSPLAGGWLSGRYRRGESSAHESSRLQRQPARHDPSLPENALKLEAVHQLQDLADQAGVSLVAPRAGVRARAPRRHVRDHRAAHHGAPRVAARRGEGLAVQGRARPDRRDRPARHHDQRGRPRLRTAGAHRRGAAAAFGLNWAVLPSGGGALAHHLLREHCRRLVPGPLRLHPRPLLGRSDLDRPPAPPWAAVRAAGAVRRRRTVPPRRRSCSASCRWWVPAS